MADKAPLQRSAEVEDLTHLTEKDRKKITEDTEKGKSSLHRSEEMEDLAHLSAQDINKPLRMGASGTKKLVKPELTKTQIENLKTRTRMTEEEIQKWYNGFYKDCPDGLLTQKQFVHMYNQAFPDGDATQYAKRIFVTFDLDNSGKIDFNEFLLAIDLMEKGNLDEKLRYAFELYDYDKNGILTKSEIEIIIKMVLSLRGEANNERLKDDIMTHLNRFIAKFDENGDMKISQDEFCRICSQDEYLREFLSPSFSS